MKKINDLAKLDLLNSILSEGEHYNATAYMTTAPNTFSMTYMFGLVGYLITSLFPDDGFARQHSGYVGVTDTGVNFVILNDFNKSQVTHTARINFADITKIKVKDRKLNANVDIWVDKKRYSFMLPRKIWGVDLECQSEDATSVAGLLNKILIAVA